MRSPDSTKGAVYQNDVGVLRRYNDHVYKLIHIKTLKVMYGESDNNSKAKIKGSAGNDEKLKANLIRARSTIQELVLCNPWELFVTFTIDGNKFDRYDLNKYAQAFSKWINNMNYRQNLAIRYLLIPEPHRDNAWHMHGFMMGIPPDQLTPFQLEENIPRRIKRRILKGFHPMDWELYRQKFGWVSVEPILSVERSASYVTKYITKQLLQSKVELNHHVFYASKHLKRSEIVCQDFLAREFTPDYQNDYVKVKMFDTLEEPLQYFSKEGS